jgi:competence protein ComEA
MLTASSIEARPYRFVILFSQAWSAVMLKKLLMLCLAFMLSVGSAFAAVDVNTADEAALDSVKGLGPVKSKAIVDERTKNGPFKDADDLANRVKGLGVKSVTKLEENGLTIGGSSTPPTGKTAASKSAAAPAPAPTAKTGGSAAPNSTVKSSTAATAATSPAATTAQTPAAAPASTPAAASSTKASKKKSKASASAASGAASGTSAASDAKPAKTKRSKKDKAASAAAASQ